MIRVTSLPSGLTRVAGIAPRAAIGIAALIAAVVSLYATFASFPVDSDISHSAMLWIGTREQGFGFLETWLFTPDSWILSYVPLHFLLFLMGGVSPALVIASGWGVFFATAATSALIARALSARIEAGVLFVAMLASSTFVHAPGFASYPMSHNITNLFGLVSILLTLEWYRTGSFWRLAAIGALLVCGGVSDPWMTAAYTLPLPLALSLLSFRYPGVRSISDIGGYVGVCAFALIATHTQLFGILDFIPQHVFALGDRAIIYSNMHELVEALGGLFGYLPGLETDRGPAAWLIVTGLLGVLATIVGRMGWGFLKGTLDAKLALLLLIAGASCSATMLAFVIGETSAGDHSARFIINVYYLVPILVAVFVAHLPRYAVWTRMGLLSVSAAFLVTSSLSLRPLLTEASLKPRESRAHALAAFLSANELEYGYGPYWGGAGNAVTWTTGGKVKVRPVIFDRVTGHMVTRTRPETSINWFDPTDAPRGQDDYFIILHSDGEECQVLSVCETGVIRQFGAPAKNLNFQGSKILVWNRPLLNYPGEFTPYRLGMLLPFTQGNVVPWLGWSTPEIGGTWNDAETAYVRLKILDSISDDLVLYFKATAFIAPQRTSQNLTVLINGRVLLTETITDGSEKVRLIRIPGDVAASRNGELEMRFKVSDPVSPLELGVSADPRTLSVGMVELRVSRAGEVAPGQDI